jgi:hypothetical protein
MLELFKRYTFWLIAAILFMFVTAILHSLSFFVSPQPNNDSERQLMTLMTTYREDMGGGFHPSMWELFTALSACYPLLCLLGGFTLGYMLLKSVDVEVMRGVILINLAIFSTCFVVMTALTFLPPIIFTGLIAVNLLAAYLTIPNADSV